MEEHQEDLQMFASELVRTFDLSFARKETCPEKETTGIGGQTEFGEKGIDDDVFF